MSFFTHLDCSARCGRGPFDPAEVHHLCACGAPLLARYDLMAARRWSRDALIGRPPSMWRYLEMLPVGEAESIVTLGEGWTPLLRARTLGDRLGFSHLFIKDESLNPTASFKARGLAAAVTKAATLGATTLSIPSAGNAGSALAAYAARARLAAQIFMPRDVPSAFVTECRAYGATVTLVDGLITDAGRAAAERGGALGWYDMSTLKEPYRIEGKKTMGYELAEQLDWTLPDVIIYPTGGGTGMIGMWKAFAELEAIGWIGRARPRMVTVQAEGCAPIVRAFEQGQTRADPWTGASTIAAGLRVPRAIGDFLILEAIRQSGGTAVAVSDDAILAAVAEIGAAEGVFAAPEGAAALAALRVLRDRGAVRPDDRIVLFNTGSGLKYIDELIDSARASHTK